MMERVLYSDGNGYPKLEHLTNFTQYEGEYEMISLPAGTLMDKNLYLLGRWV
jgi:hypothetical protein